MLNMKIIYVTLFFIVGLGKMKSLKVLQLSHNRISVIDPVDLAGCTNLSELYLQHNLINTIHPEAFKDLQKLKVTSCFLTYFKSFVYDPLNPVDTLVLSPSSLM